MEEVKLDIDLKNLDKSKWLSYRFDEIATKISETVDPATTDRDVYVGLEHLDVEDIHIRRRGVPGDVKGGKLKCYPGDIIFGKRRAYQRKAGIVDFEGICSAHAFVFRAIKEVIDPKLFPFFLHSDEFMHRMVDISVGGLSPTINWGDLKHQEFLLPPKAQQAKLAELLWAMDEVVESERNLLNQNLIIEKSFVEDVIHGRYLNLNGNKESIIGNIPSSWDVVYLEELVTITDGAHHTPKYTTDGVPFLRVTDIQKSIIDMSKVKWISELEHASLIKRCNPEKGDILYSKNGTIGISKIINWDWQFSIFVSLALMKIKDRSRLEVKYLKAILDSLHVSKEIRRRSKQGTVTNLHLEEIRRFRIPLPPTSIQNIIVNKIDAMSQSKLMLEERIESSVLLRKSLINQIF